MNNRRRPALPPWLDGPTSAIIGTVLAVAVALAAMM